MSTIIGILVFLIMLAFVFYLWRKNDQGQPPL
jgi:Mg2+ and Co2+ transporter CorA